VIHFQGNPKWADRMVKSRLLLHNQKLEMLISAAIHRNHHISDNILTLIVRIHGLGCLELETFQGVGEYRTDSTLGL
jgi:hypothetical protein